MYAVRRPVENVYLVRERDRRRTRELLAFALAALPPMAVLFAAIWANLETVRLGYQLEGVEKQREALVEKNRQLKTARAEAAALARVEEIAHRSLGLSAPRPDQLILIEDATLAAAAPTPVKTIAPAEDLVGPPAPVSTEEGF